MMLERNLLFLSLPDEKMISRICWQRIFVIALLFGLSFHTGAQDRRYYTFEEWEFRSDVLTLEKFQPWSTGLLVVESKQLKFPTIFSLETPKLKRVRVDPDFERIKSEWAQKHPRSAVIEIHHYPFLKSQGMNHAREAYVWVIASGKILNIELVRRGACNASTMLLDPENEPYILIPRDLYLEIKNRILEAEENAKAEGLGIWMKKEVQNQ
ncbi:MAG: hypothetical protein KF881_04550 [Acidobacteria bacterium]|nr:hypothetical protein [Acidobacteriota bacterium]